MIRNAVVMDMPRLLELGGAYVREADGFKQFDVDAAHAMRVMTNYLALEDALVLVAIEETKVVGFFMALIQPTPWSTRRLAVDSLLYVSPEARGKAHGVRLLKRYEAWAMSRNAEMCIVSVGSGITEDRTSLLYEKLGYQKLGIQFRKELTHG
jgi:GNAT superfamily N-acetyltransferase